MNATPEPARATVTVVNRGDANALTGGISVSVAVAGTPVEVGIAVGDLDRQQGTSQDFALDIDVTLSHLGPGAATVPCQELVAEVDDPEDGTTESKDPDCSRTPVVTVTGIGAATGAVWLVVGGLLLLLASRRRRRPPTHRAG